MKAMLWKSFVLAAGGLSRGTLGMGGNELITFGCRIVRRVEASTNVCLTFDDSPDPETTLPILASLKAHSVRATFFVIGDRVRRHPEILKRIQDDGHELANHTQHHINLHKVLPSTLRKEIVDCQETVVQHAGVRPRLFRAPFGNFRSDMRNVGKLAGIEQLVGWDVTPFISETDPEVIVADVLASARRGSIILLHDGLIGAPPGLSRQVGAAVAASLHDIIPGLLDRGMRLVTAGELLGEMTAAHAKV